MGLLSRVTDMIPGAEESGNALGADSSGGGFGGDDVFDDAGGLDGDDMLGGDDVLGGGDAFGGGGDAFGDGDGFGGDGGDVGFEGGSASNDELLNGMSDLETEVNELSSTMNTVRGENAELSETVNDLEEKIRKLLEIYEVVTRDAHPFVDGVPMGDAGGSDEGGFFDTDDDFEEEEEEELDDTIAEADSEEFFGDDLDEAAADDAEADDAMEEDAMEDDMDTDIDTGGGSSFEELKAEYEAGEADWADEEAEAEAEADEDLVEAEPELEPEPEPAMATGTDGGVSMASDAAADDEAFGLPGADESETTLSGTDTDDSEATADAGGLGSADPDVVDDSEKPYLARLPAGPVGDAVVLRWLEYLIGQSDTDEVAAAIDYYESIRWVSETVASEMRALLVGLGGPRPAEDDRGADDGSDEFRPLSTLTIDHHLMNLRFFNMLADSTAETIALGGWAEKFGGPGDRGWDLW